MLKSRKKMLLSSIAMLLVALIALGSATFAWYFSNPKVTADKATIGASTAEGLEIRKFTGAKLANTNTWSDWDTHVDLSTEASLNPSSIDYNGALSNVTYATGGVGKGYSNGALDNTLTKVTSGYATFLIDRFQVASSSDTGVNVSWKITDVDVPDTITYMTFAVYKGGVFVGSWTTGGNTQKVKVTEGTFDGSEGVAYTNTGTLVDDTDIDSTTNPTQFANFVSGTKTNPTDFTVIGFADGFNENCTSQNAKNDQVKISFEFNKVS